MSNFDFRPYVPSPEESKIAGETARRHAKAVFKKDRIRGLFANWNELFSKPFKGITTDGVCRNNLFFLKPEYAPAEAVFKASEALLNKLSLEQKRNTTFSTEIFIEEHGLRLDEVEPNIRNSVMMVIKASLSADGYEKTRNVMRLNRFLGELVGGPDVMGEWSYTFCLFGAPSMNNPWGWQLFGHHLALNCLFIGQQMVLTPTFFGAEPVYADVGSFKGLTVFKDEEREGLEFMRSLTSIQQSQALLANSMVGGDLQPDRRQVGDGLHLGGAYQDNRIIPYEGVTGNTLSLRQNRNLLDLIIKYLDILPAGPLSARMNDIERHLNMTHFCWIGSRKREEPFYYRIQSPVLLVEFDHHAGVYLTNEEPANFHVHTLVRTPNGNDYGIDLIRQHYRNSEHHQSSG